MLHLELQASQEQTIRKHAQDAFPNECCGFLLGQDVDDVRRVATVIPAINDCAAIEQHNRFSITPETFLAADRTARQQKLDVLGFYHSHPNAPAQPSQYDLDHAWPVCSYVIVSVVRNRRVCEMTSWILRDDRSQFDEQTITIAPKQEFTECP